VAADKKYSSAILKNLGGVMKRLVWSILLSSSVFVSFPEFGQASERFPVLSVDQLSPAQKQWADKIATLPRKADFRSLPYRIYLRSPELADSLTATNEYLRNTALPTRITQLAILIAARELRAHYIWRAHYQRTIAGGLDPTVLADMAAGIRPAKLKSDEAALYDLAMEIYRNKMVSDDAYGNAIKHFGEHGVVELLALMGYYGMVSMMVITANVPVERDDRVPSLQDAAR
jgi:4-carboxymuconolactone decarboxylase